MIQELTVVGIDISKARFDVCAYPAGKHWSTSSSPEQITALIKRIQALGPVVVGLEASGGYERRLADSLHAAGVKVYILPPQGFAALPPPWGNWPRLTGSTLP
ncbi:hypothetical protein DSM25558_5553 [Agrobacterium sp. DSM 25558]|uniref:IS110 family transposase n=1 Tax=Agrobacterium sp. DSM 25558 TaxID=1907665 RepID=UPI0009725422|nr:transposase [Agrobacterium sp. DSM 25558]SCX32916.1 hypothetical protein DSM25558_5553 [Agrobacterium sp. DSM 25558]